MATDNKSNVKISKSALSALKQLTNSSDRLLKVQLDLEKDDLDVQDETNRTLTKLNNIILQNYNNLVGNKSDVTPNEINQILALSKNDANMKDNNIKKKLNDFKREIQTGNDQLISSMFMERKSNKSQVYPMYDTIMKLIPKMQLIINTYVNTIISPDDFTKNSITYDYTKKNINNEDTAKINNRINSIIDKYNITDTLKEDIQEYLIKGELAIAVLSINDEIRKLLTESQTNMDKGYFVIKEAFINESVDFQDNLLLEEGLELFKDHKDSKVTKSIIASSLNEIFEKGFVIAGSSHLLEEYESIEKSIHVNPMIDKLNHMGNVHHALNNKTDNKVKRFHKKVENHKFTTDTAILKKLNLTNLVKLDYDGKNYGFLYIDDIEVDERIPNFEKDTTNTYNTTPYSDVNTFNNVLYSGRDLVEPSKLSSGNLDKFTDSKLQFIAKSFTNKLSKELNLKLLKKNEQFKNAIYNSLRTVQLLKKDKVRITFFKADEIVYIDRKQSIFDNIMFFAKIYIAALITALMQNIIRGADKRAYYVETGLENDSANAINSVIRDIKSKDISGLHNMDIASILNVVGLELTY